MKKIVLLLTTVFLFAFAPILNSGSVGSDFFKVTPISHATMVIDWGGTIIYVDPVGGAALFSEQPKPDIILITDIHGDHLDLETIVGINTSETTIIAPEAVSKKLLGDYTFKIETLDNGEISTQKEIKIEAIPMYNLREEAKKFHSKGRGNGYVIEKNKKRIYISGDTEDIPEMRALKNIDAAFVCMNLPYTMTVSSAADAVLEFKPKTIYPYHYRGTEGLSDLKEFKKLIEKGNNEINVVQLDWYPKK
jgi:L-ascorbate metabolism protein UlaG (beta-lactamase superfamily)